MAELKQAVEQIEFDAAIRVIIVTGSGKAFVAGADIVYMKDMTSLEAVEFSKSTLHLYELIHNSDKIYIAAVNGFALGGGCEFALAMDIRIASENAKFGLPEAGLGILPGGGGTQRLPRTIGTSKALELMVTCERFGAQEAKEIGLISDVVPANKLMEHAHSVAQKILKNAPISVKYIKSCINMSMESSLSSGIEYENQLFGLCFSTEDQSEGMASFVEKRQPKFEGK